MTKAELKELLESLDHKDDALLKWERGKPQPEPTKPERGLDARSSELDWNAWNRWCDSRIQSALIEQRKFLLDTVAEVIGEYVGQQRQLAKQELADELRQLRIELAETQAVIGELRSVVAAERGVIKLPSPLRARVN